MKKLMTVAKSKYYMLKVNYSKIFERVDFEEADGSFNPEPSNQGADRLSQDLKRGDPTANNQNAAGNQRQAMIDKLKAPIEIKPDAEDLNSEEQVRSREEVIEKDKKRKTAVDGFTDELVKAMEATKEIDQAYEESGYQEHFRSLEYCEREEDPELKKMYEEEQERFNKLSERMYGKVDGELDMDLHGNITFRPPGVK